MDTRKRPANKRFRQRTSGKDQAFLTISLCLYADVINFIEKKVINDPENNFSSFIEREVSLYIENKKLIITPMEKKHAYGSRPVKKTFTFSPGFVSLIDKSENRSLFIETILRKKFKI